MDFDTMRSNCIQIHQECYELGIVAEVIGIPKPTIDKDELSKNPKTKSWDGMGRYAKEIYDDDKLWNKLPSSLYIVLPHNNQRKKWDKKETKDSLLDCFYQLGGATLYEHIKN